MLVFGRELAARGAACPKISRGINVSVRSVDFSLIDSGEYLEACEERGGARLVAYMKRAGERVAKPFLTAQRAKTDVQVLRFAPIQTEVLSRVSAAQRALFET